MSDEPRIVDATGTVPPAEAPVPPVPAVVLVPTTASATDRDVASDLAGQPRSDDPQPPPPGTEEESFWQRSGTQVAIVATVGLGLMFLRSLILGEPVSREAVAVAAEAVVWGWLAAAGIHAAGPGSLRYK